MLFSLSFSFLQAEMLAVSVSAEKQGNIVPKRHSSPGPHPNSPLPDKKPAFTKKGPVCAF
ncbi:hypothetical protein AB434_0355 [Heyndrickxia coagulans]|uniref:Uncharacterized protein n=1 Tax=Heyndrickxia coagulans TaxID=1398 RepID=A0AAN0T2Q3_HEYCO|nr:hypothetical protein SB48_HM08orf01277 [Heyndrickxia coagulans]AKN52760.1 hypothetical protein AB434_0355 [Heyndrickxia coagulans]KYC84116.1 hypothetical protein B4096_2062 [Heyndrickxia coagulans]